MPAMWPGKSGPDRPDPEPPVDLTDDRLGPEVRKELEKVQIKHKVKKGKAGR